MTRYDDDDEPDDPLKGLIAALPMAVALWAVIFALGYVACQVMR